MARLSSVTGTQYIIGTLWNAFLLVENVDADTELNDFLGYHWRQLCANWLPGSFWVAKEAAS